MNILQKIVQQKRKEVAQARQQISVGQLEATPDFSRVPYVLKDFLADTGKTGIIAEYKRQSPSKGIINGTATVTDVTQGYARAGASALSVLTDSMFFGGSKEDLLQARACNSIPILRKDFIIDEYQIVEAKAWGADIILLIAAILTSAQVQRYGKLAQQLGLSVLLEVHDEEELQRSLCPNLDAVGVNNRNLADFTVNIQTSFQLADQIPDKFLKVSESAIDNPQVISELRKAGYQGFLIGENFMKTANPGAAMASFVSGLKSR